VVWVSSVATATEDGGGEVSNVNIRTSFEVIQIKVWSKRHSPDGECIGMVSANIVFVFVDNTKRIVGAIVVLVSSGNSNFNCFI
jgi:hypothetical protein